MLLYTATAGLITPETAGRIMVRGDNRLEAFCVDVAEAAQVNADVQVAIADQLLRNEIALRAAPEIGALVSGILNRASGE